MSGAEPRWHRIPSRTSPPNENVAGTRPQANAVGNVQRLSEPVGVPVVRAPGVNRTRLTIIREGPSPG